MRHRVHKVETYNSPSSKMESTHTVETRLVIYCNSFLMTCYLLPIKKQPNCRETYAKSNGWLKQKKRKKIIIKSVRQVKKKSHKNMLWNNKTKEGRSIVMVIKASGKMYVHRFLTNHKNNDILLPNWWEYWESRA